MTDKTKELQNEIDKLKLLIVKKKKENALLENKKIKLNLQASRYQKIFDKSYISMWEEDISEVYNFLENLPCKSGKELSDYLSKNPKITKKAIRRIKVIQINDYTIKMFESDSKKHLLDSLSDITNIISVPGFIKLFRAMKEELSPFSYETSAFTLSGKKLDLFLTVYLPGKDKGNILISMNAITNFCVDNKSLCRNIGNTDHLIRIKHSHGYYLLETLHDNTSRVTWVQHTNPEGDLPIWLINQMIQNLPYKTLLGLRKEVFKAKYQNKRLNINHEGKMIGFIK